MEAFVIIGAAAGAFAAQVGRLTKHEQSKNVAAVGSLLWAGFPIMAFIATGWQNGMFTIAASIVASLTGVLAVSMTRMQR